jgi:hypothetical protein
MNYTPKRPRNASRIRMLQHRRTSHRITIRLRIIHHVSAMTARARIMAAAAIAAQIVAVTEAVADAGAAVADGVTEAAHRVVRVAAGICLLQNMLRHRAANPAATTIAARNRAITTIGVRKGRETQGLLPRNPPRSRSFFLANRSRNIAASRQHHLRPLLPLIMKRMKNGLPQRKLHHARPGIWPLPLPQAPAFLAGSPADCLAGYWPMQARKPKQQAKQKLRARPRKPPSRAAQPSSPPGRRLRTNRNPFALMLI